MPLQGVSEGGKFPGSEVSGEKQNAFATSVSALEVLKSVIDDDTRDIFAGVAGKKADFGKLASEGDEFAANQAAALARRHFGKGETQIAEADATKAPVNRIDSEPECNSNGTRHGTGEQAQDLDPGPD
jgi:hypothetical protein